MGCFSFICKECGKPILSDSARGQEVELFLLQDGDVMERMSGEYNSYGCVFNEDRTDSIDWKMEWGDVCELMFDGKDGNGIAAIHSKCFNKVPKTKSDDDPDQGWGYLGEKYDPKVDG